MLLNNHVPSRSRALPFSRRTLWALLPLLVPAAACSSGNDIASTPNNAVARAAPPITEAQCAAHQQLMQAHTDWIIGGGPTPPNGWTSRPIEGGVCSEGQLWKDPSSCTYTVLFKGTSNFNDAVTDLSTLPQTPPLTVAGTVVGGPVGAVGTLAVAGTMSCPYMLGDATANVHYGFTNCALSYMESLLAMINADGCAAGANITVSGHSLGGALAALVAPLLNAELNGATVNLVTFAAPRITTDEGFFGNLGYDSSLAYNYYIQNDPVPLLPPNYLGIVSPWQPIEGSNIGFFQPSGVNQLETHYPITYLQVMNAYCANLNTTQLYSTSPPDYTLLTQITGTIVSNATTAIQLAQSVAQAGGNIATQQVSDAYYTASVGIPALINGTDSPGNGGYWAWEQRGNWCASSGPDQVRRNNSTYVTYTPPYNTCVDCCAADPSVPPNVNKCADQCAGRIGGQGGTVTRGAVYEDQYCSYTGSLPAGTTLQQGYTLCSPDRRFRAFMQTDGNFVVYQINADGSESPIWASNTPGQGTSVSMQGDCNLVVYNGSSATWSSGTSGGNSGCSLAMQGDGNLVVYQNGTPLWASQQGTLAAPTPTTAPPAGNTTSTPTAN